MEMEHEIKNGHKKEPTLHGIKKSNSNNSPVKSTMGDDDHTVNHSENIPKNKQIVKDKILQQMLFYFSNVNLCSDPFLRNLMAS